MSERLTSTRITINGQPVMTARDAPNHLTLRTGRRPSSGRFTLLAKHYVNLALGDDVTVEWAYTLDGGTTTVSWGGFRVVNAQRLRPTVLNSPGTIDIADARHTRSAIAEQWEEDDDATWQDIADAVSAELPAAISGTLDTPPDAPPEVIYRCDAWDAIGDVAARTGHLVWVDPSTGSTRLGRYGYTQPGLSAALSAGLLAADGALAATPKREAIGTVRVLFSWRAGPDVAPFAVDVENPAGGDGVHLLWGYARPTGTDPDAPDNQAALESEADAIAQTVFDWSAGVNADRRSIVLFGVHAALEPGVEVSEVTIEERRGQTYSRVRLNDHPFPAYLPSPFTVAPEVSQSVIVLTPPAGIPARDGVGVTPTTCDVWQIDAATNDLVDASQTVDVYSIDGVIAGDIYVVAHLLDDGTYAASAGMAISWGAADDAIMPGGSGDVTPLEWTGSDFQPNGDPAVTIYDSGYRNCILPGETVPYYVDPVTGRNEVFGSTGLDRWARALEDIIPDRTPAGVVTWHSEYQCELVTFGPGETTVPTLGGYGSWTHCDPVVEVTVADPLRMSCIWTDQVFPVSWSVASAGWVVRVPTGSTQRARIKSVSLTGGEGEVFSAVATLYHPEASDFNSWAVASIDVTVKQDRSRFPVYTGDDIEIFREPVGRYVASPLEYKASEWHVGRQLEALVVCTLTPTTGPEPVIAPRYDIRLPDGRLLKANVDLASYPPYSRISTIAYYPGTAAAIVIRWHSTVLAQSNIRVLAADEQPDREECTS